MEKKKSRFLKDESSSGLPHCSLRLPVGVVVGAAAELVDEDDLPAAAAGVEAEAEANAQTELELSLEGAHTCCCSCPWICCWMARANCS